jgi:hypothetical protein
MLPPNNYSRRNMSTATVTVPNSLKGLAKIKGARATVTRITDGKSATGVLHLMKDGKVRVMTGQKGRPFSCDRRLIGSITLAETEAAQELASAG